MYLKKVGIMDMSDTGQVLDFLRRQSGDEVLLEIDVASPGNEDAALQSDWVLVQGAHTAPRPWSRATIADAQAGRAAFLRKFGQISG